MSLLMTALLQFFISYAMAMLAFWLLEISTLIFILFAFEYLSSGHLFPLDLLPLPLQHVLCSRRFRISFICPSAFTWGGLAGRILCRGLLAQLVWVLLAYLFARFLWRRGIKKYAAFGG